MVDLVGYEKRIGGLDQAATVIADVGDCINPDLVRNTSANVLLSLGYSVSAAFILDSSALCLSSMPLKTLTCGSGRATLLCYCQPPATMGRYAKDWRLLVNAEIEVDA